MKIKLILILVFCFLFKVNAQENVSVEKSIFGTQTGFLGVWMHNELKLSKSIALRSEVGFDSGIFGGDYYDNTYFILYPSLTVEPRFYYNLKVRSKKQKSILKNSGNFLTIKLNYTPNWFTISNVENIEVIDSFSVIPKWAIKRTIADHLTYETGIGLGYRTYFLKNSNEGEIALDLHLRIGYTF